MAKKPPSIPRRRLKLYPDNQLLLFSSANYAHFRHTDNSELLTNGNIFHKRLHSVSGFIKL